MAILAFVKSEKVFLKIQEGTGDNLLDEDEEEGYVDYVLWSTFKTGSLGIDSELEMECIDSGKLLMKKICNDVRKTLPRCYKLAFDKKYKASDVVIVGNDNE